MRLKLSCGLGLLAFGISASIATAVPVVQNASFEGGFMSTNGPYGTIADWAQVPFPSGFPNPSYNNLAGVSSTSDFPWDNGTVPSEGTSGKVGFIQVAGNVTELSLEQTISGFDPTKTYKLTYDENSRAQTQVPLVTILLGGNVIVAQHLDPAVDPQGTYSTSFNVLTSTNFTVPSGSALLEVRVDQQVGNGDATATFDNFSISEAPEPASFGLCAIAGLIALARRDRKA